MEELKLDTYPEECKCPKCGSYDVYYAPFELDEDGEVLTYRAECENCGTKYCECYDLVFAGQWNIVDKEGNRYEGLPT